MIKQESVKRLKDLLTSFCAVRDVKYRMSVHPIVVEGRTMFLVAVSTHETQVRFISDLMKYYAYLGLDNVEFLADAIASLTTIRTESCTVGYYFYGWFDHAK